MTGEQAARTVPVLAAQLPESVSDATLLEWHKQAGDTVRRDENLVDLETDKVVLDTPAPVDGVLVEIRCASGTTVHGGEVIAIIEPRAFEPAAASAAATAETSAPKQPSREQTVREPSPQTPAEEQPRPGAAAQGPAVRRLIAEHGLDAAAIAGSGRHGRILKEDVTRHLAAAATQTAPLPDAVTPAAPAAVAPGERQVRRVPMSRLRARIAERMVEAQRTTAAVTTFNEVNMQAVLDLRRRYSEQFQQRHGVKLGLMSFFVRAAVIALQRFAIVNAAVDDSAILYHDFYDIGIAVASPRGLVVPVVRDADRLSLAQIEAQIRDYSQRAQDGKLTMEDLTGGTFSITNGGVFGSMLSTPVINPPQSAILGMHRIQERPVAEDGEVRIRPVMYLALSYDHRIIDGADAVQFLVHIKAQLEDPARILLDL